MASNRSRFEQLVDVFEPRIRDAFLDAIADVRDRVTMRQLVERLEKGDVSGAIEALNLDPAAFGPLDLAIAEAFNAGGADTIAGLPLLRDPNGHRIVFRWDVRNLAAEQWLRQHSAELVTRILDDQRTGIRSALVTGLEAGRNPRSVALDIVGRVSRPAGARVGGIIGLTAQQARFVDNARSELLSGDPVDLQNYLGRRLRDKRFDRAVVRAINGGALDRATVDKMLSRYADGLLRMRGEAIARTETLAALGKAQSAAMDQAVASGKIKADAVTKVWHTAGDNRVRDSHAAMAGETVPLNGLFSNGLAFPCDPAGPVEESINCRCWMEHRIDHLAGIR